MDSLSPFVEQCESIGHETFKDDAGRRKALAAARAVCGRLETPMETVLRITWTEPSTALVARVAIDRDLFSKLAEGDGGPKTVSELAKATKIDPVLLGRFLRHLAAVDFVKETGSDTFLRTTLSDALIKPEVNGAFDLLYDIMMPSYTKLPEYLEKTEYKNPDGVPGPWQYVTNQDLVLFDWLEQYPKKMQGFQNHMRGYTAERPGWLDIYPADKLFNTETPILDTDALIVDVGGGYGQDLERFRSRYPDAPGRLILQERPGVLEKASVNGKIELMTHDFFASQPVEGARAYFLHSILHGGDDDRCRRILNPLKAVMKRGYSKVLINENAIPATGANVLATSMDMIIMSCQSAMERTEAHWQEILESVGLKMVQVHTSSAVESIIEAELA